MGRNKFINRSQLKLKFIIPIYNMYILKSSATQFEREGLKEGGAYSWRYVARAERRLQHVYTNKRYLRDKLLVASSGVRVCALARFQASPASPRSLRVLIMRMRKELCFVTKIGLFCKHTFLPIVVQFARLLDWGIECSTVS